MIKTLLKQISSSRPPAAAAAAGNSAGDGGCDAGCDVGCGGAVDGNCAGSSGGGSDDACDGGGGCVDRGLPHQRLLFTLRCLELHKADVRPEVPIVLRQLSEAVTGKAFLDVDPEVVGVEVVDLTLDESEGEVIDVEALVERLTPLAGRDDAPPAVGAVKVEKGG